jgi:hypothetical protein
MSARGVFFSLDKAQAKRLLKAEDEDAVMEQVEAIEEAWEEDHLVECDKAWDALHRCLSDGTLDFEGGEYPLNRCVLGGQQLIGEEDYIAAFVKPEEVRDVAKALEPLTEAGRTSRTCGGSTRRRPGRAGPCSSRWRSSYSAQGKDVLSVLEPFTPGPVRVAVTVTEEAQV